MNLTVLLRAIGCLLLLTEVGQQAAATFLEGLLREQMEKRS